MSDAKTIAMEDAGDRYRQIHAPAGGTYCHAALKNYQKNPETGKMTITIDYYDRAIDTRDGYTMVGFYGMDETFYYNEYGKFLSHKPHSWWRRFRDWIGF